MAGWRRRRRVRVQHALASGEPREGAVQRVQGWSSGSSAVSVSLPRDAALSLATRSSSSSFAPTCCSRRALGAAAQPGPPQALPVHAGHAHHGPGATCLWLHPPWLLCWCGVLSPALWSPASAYVRLCLPPAHHHPLTPCCRACERGRPTPRSCSPCCTCCGHGCCSRARVRPSRLSAAPRPLQMLPIATHRPVPPPVDDDGAALPPPNLRAPQCCLLNPRLRA